MVVRLSGAVGRSFLTGLMLSLPFAGFAAQEKGQAIRSETVEGEAARNAGHGDRLVASARKDAVPVTIVADDNFRRSDSAAGVKPGLAVIFPELGEPYRSIFAKIVDGIEDKARSRVIAYSLGNSVDAAALNAILKRQGVRVVIALGRQGLQTAAQFDKDIAVVAGGIVSMPENDSRYAAGLTLTPDPALLFAKLKSFQPSVKRVSVVYDPQKNDWLIRLARESAKAYGIELAAFEARDLAAAARAYEAIFQSADGRRDAIWLPQDSTTVDEGTILPLVLRESWGKSIPVFSSSFLHVKKGVLFALYPNNQDLGQSLGAMALGLLAGESGRKGMAPLRDVFTAVNLRTASHIGLNLGSQQNSFDAVFPEP